MFLLTYLMLRSRLHQCYEFFRDIIFLFYQESESFKRIFCLIVIRCIIHLLSCQLFTLYKFEEFSISQIFARIIIDNSRSTTRIHFSFLVPFSKLEIGWRKFSISSRSMRYKRNKSWSRLEQRDKSKSRYCLVKKEIIFLLKSSDNKGKEKPTDSDESLRKHEDFCWNTSEKLSKSILKSG